MTATDIPVPRRSNWLIASVALNLFLLGGIASALLLGPHRPPGPHGGGRDRPVPFERMASGLSPEGREILFRMRVEDDAAMAPQLAALRLARDGMDRAFAAEPFDRAAFDDAFAAMRTAEAAMSVHMNQRMAALAAALSPADRAVFRSSLRRLPVGPPGGAPPDRPPGR
jgi:uncharacterized membrane protein